MAAFVLATVGVMDAVDFTADEAHYLNSGRVIRVDGWVHDLTRLHGPLPYYLNQTWLPDFPSGGWQGGDDPQALLFWGRLGLLPFGLCAAIVLFVWSRRVFGDAGGLLSLGLFALNPLMIGYSGTLLTDMAHCASVLFVLYLTWSHMQAPKTRSLIWIGVALGLALATKFLALFVVPIVLALLICTRRWPQTDRLERIRTPATNFSAWGRGALEGGLVLGLAVLTLHATYLFQVGGAPTDPAAYRSEFFRVLSATPGLGALLGWLPEPFVLGCDFQRSNAERPWLVYLNGRYGWGHWDYYAWAILRKSPEWVPFFALVGAVSLAWRAWRRRLAVAERCLLLVVLPVAVVYFGYMSLVTQQIGVRYVIVLFPILFLIAGGVTRTQLWSRIPRPALGVGALGLLLAHVWILSNNWPNLLAYYNESSGGQEYAYRYFKDSNSDFGQLREAGLARLRAEELRPFTVLRAGAGPRFGRVAFYVDDLLPPDDLDPTRGRDWLPDVRPVRTIGAAWWLFDVSAEDFERHVERGGDPRAREDLIVAYLGAGRLDEARRHLEELPVGSTERYRALLQALEAHDEEAPLADVFTLAQAWRELGRFDCVERLMQLDRPRLAVHPHRQVLLGEAWIQQGQEQEALQLLERSEEELPWPGIRLLAHLYIQVGNLDQAFTVLQRFLERADPSARARAAALLEEVRRLQADQARYRAALS